MYLIDRLALRAGNEKGDDEADTVGCCSLRYEHIELEPPNTLHFDFLGKDSIRYQNSVKVDPQVFKNIKIFRDQVGHGNPIFDRLTVRAYPVLFFFSFYLSFKEGALNTAAIRVDVGFEPSPE